MKFVTSTQVKLHETARERFIIWSRKHSGDFQPLAEQLVVTQGHPEGAMELENKRWIWAFRETFVSYVVKDKPYVSVGNLVLVDRFVLITDLFVI